MKYFPYKKSFVGLWMFVSICLFAVSPKQAYAEDRSAKNSVYVEGLGTGFFYSINYERLLLEDLGLRVGFEYAPLQSTWTAFDAYAFSFPLTLNYLGLGVGPHSFDAGAGVSLNHSVGKSLHAEKPGFEIYGLGTAGYRYQPTDGGFQFRAGAVLLVGKDVAHKFETNSSVLAWPYLSVGWAF